MASVKLPRYIDGVSMGADVDGDWINVMGCRDISFQAKWTESAERTIVVTDADNVDVSEETWNFANGAFTAADVGGSFTITGTTGALNDGTFTIASVTDANTVVSVETPGGSDETFAGTEVLTLEQLPPTGTFGVDVSNDGPADNTGLTPSGNIGPTALTLTAAMVAANPAEDESDFLFEFRDMSVNWIRFVYATTTGGGVLQVAAKAS